MPDCDLLDPFCHATSAAGSAAVSTLESIARQVGETAADWLRRAFTWWLEVESISPDSDGIRAMQDYTLPIAALMLTGSVLVQAIRMSLSRRKDPAINVAVGLFWFAVVNAVGLAVLAAALRAGDAYAEWMLRDAVQDYVEPIAVAFGELTVVGLPGMLVLGLIGMLLALIQFVLAFFRQAGILVLAAMLPLAASGSINDSTRVWMSRMVPWLLALVLYKPMAAMIYTIGIMLMTDEDQFVVTVVGLFVMLLAVVALPAMLRFFAWSQVTATGGAGVAGAVAGGATGVVTAASLLSARRQQMTGPGTAPAGASVAGSGGSSPPSAAAGPPAGPPPGGPSGGGGVSGGVSVGVSGGVAAAQMAYQAGQATARRLTDEAGSPAPGAAGVPQAGVPSARSGGGVAPAAGAGGASAPAAGAAGGTAAAGAGSGGTGGAPAAAAGTAPGGGAAGGVAAARAAQQAAEATARRMTDEGQAE